MNQVFGLMAHVNKYLRLTLDSGGSDTYNLPHFFGSDGV